MTQLVVKVCPCGGWLNRRLH